MQLLPSPIGTPPARCEQRFFHAPALSYQYQVRCIQVEPTKTGPIGTDCVSKDKGIAPVIFGSRDTVTITKPVQLLGMNRQDVEASFESSFNNRATRHFKSHGDPLRLSHRQRSTAKPPAAPDWLHHGPRPVHPPGDGRGRAHRPAAAGSPNQSPQTTRTISADQLVLDAWHSVR